MPFNRFEQYVPIQWNLPKTDLNVLANVLQAKQQRFDTGYELANKMSEYAVDALPQDRARANQIMQEWDTQKQGIVDNYKGDYSSAYRDLRGLASDIEKQLRPGGEANAILSNKKAFSEWYTAAAKDKEVNPDTLNAAYNYYMGENSKGYYSGVGEKNPITGNYNIFNPEQIMPSVNPDDVVLPAIDKLKASGFEEEYDQVRGMWILKNKVSGEEVSYDRIYSTALNSLTTHDKYFPSLGQELRFKGIEDMDAFGTASMLADQYAKNFSYRKTKESQTRDANQVALHFDKEARKDARQNKAMQQFNDMYWNKGTLEYGTIGNTTKELTPFDFAPTGKEIGRLSSVGIGAPVSTGGIAIAPKKAFTYGDLIENLRSGAFAEKGDPVVMEQVIKENPNVKDPSEVFSLYNKMVKEIGNTTKPSTVKLGPASKEVTQSLIMGKQYRNAPMWIVEGPNSSPRQLSPQEKDKYIDGLYDGDKYKGAFVDDLVDASNGMTPSFQLPLGDGKSLFIGAPDSYARQFDDIQILGSSKFSKNGVTELKSGLMVDQPYIGLDNYGQPAEMEIKAGTPIRNKSIITKNASGQRTKEDVLEVYDSKANTWRRIQAAGQDRETGELVPRNLQLNELEAWRKERALPQFLGKLKTTATNQTMQMFGNQFDWE